MASAQKDPVLVVLQLTGGNDYLNTVIPYNNPLYQDNRKAVGIPESQILAFDNEYGFPSYLAPLKKVWDENKLAIMHGVGYLDSPRSHFRSMDIWHTCEAEKVGTEGWLGRVVREFDPRKENVVTAVSFGPCLFRALAVPGVPVACVAGALENYGFLPNIQEPTQRQQVLERFSRMYQPIEGSGVMEYLGTTGLDSLKGADILKVAPSLYKSDVKYPEHLDRQQAARHRTGAPRGPGHPDLLLRPRQLRQPRRTESAACQTVDRRVGRSGRVHDRPPPARCGRQRHRADVLGIRPSRP